MELESLIGKRFGTLIVTKYLGLRPDGKYHSRFWECKCDCGNIIEASTKSLKSGNIKSCGCTKRIQIQPGTKFGRLTVLERIACVTGKKRSVFKCKCDCGNIVNVDGSHLIGGDTRSCGCLHTKYDTPEKVYASNIYYGMIQRCTNPKNQEYRNYGARGITISNEFDTCQKFVDWAIQRADFYIGKTIERDDVNGPYSPRNCRWTGMKDQGNNRRNNHFFIVDGVKRSVSQWGVTLGVSIQTLFSKIRCHGDDYLQQYLDHEVARRNPLIKQSKRNLSELAERTHKSLCKISKGRVV